MLPQVDALEHRDTIMPGSEIAPVNTIAINTTTTAGSIGLFQVFDEYSPNLISEAEASADGGRYGAVWGSRIGMSSYWHVKNSALTLTYYMPQSTDQSYGAWGEIGHTLSWWQEHDPTWVLYACTSAGTPTKTPAWLSQLPYNVPLDIHNPAVVAYQIKNAAMYAHSQGYGGLAIDQVLLENVTGTGVASTDYGCGIYENGTFVRRYTGREDPAWTADTVAWVKAAHAILKTDPVIGPYGLKLVLNHPAANIGSLNEQAIVLNADAVLDEVGFSDYGNYTEAAASALATVTLNWMTFAQSHGVVPLIIDKFAQSTPISTDQLEYSIATYLLGNTSSARLFVGNEHGYGAEQYHPEYTTNFGTPCGAFYGGATYDASNPNILYRRFSNAVVVVNTGSLPRVSEIAHLPPGHTYRDLEQRAITNPLTVHSNDAYVMLTATGYGCTGADH